mmetsp:Transcript_55612/g.136464  ORF Transcript_55612/g.136464 Transcript_55612/m.136464 type:complete len:208 (+) Transcript_55612:158-781(+)
MRLSRRELLAAPVPPLLPSAPPPPSLPPVVAAAAWRAAIMRAAAAISSSVSVLYCADVAMAASLAAVRGVFSGIGAASSAAPAPAASWSPPGAASSLMVGTTGFALPPPSPPAPLEPPSPPAAPPPPPDAPVSSVTFSARNDGSIMLVASSSLTGGLYGGSISSMSSFSKSMGLKKGCALMSSALCSRFCGSRSSSLRSMACASADT